MACYFGFKSYGTEVTEKFHSKLVGYLPMTDKFHEKAKDAGNKLKAYILSISSGATGVFFFTLTAKDVSHLTITDKSLIIGAITLFAITVILSLIELHIDAKRFFNIASQLEKAEHKRDWKYNDKLKTIRLVIIYMTYFSISTAFILTFIYMLYRVD